jgi:hypothetical protein
MRRRREGIRCTCRRRVSHVGQVDRREAHSRRSHDRQQQRTGRRRDQTNGIELWRTRSIDERHCSHPMMYLTQLTLNLMKTMHDQVLHSKTAEDDRNSVFRVRSSIEGHTRRLSSRERRRAVVSFPFFCRVLRDTRTNETRNCCRNRFRLSTCHLNSIEVLRENETFSSV